MRVFFARKREGEGERAAQHILRYRRRCDDTLLHRHDIYVARDTPREREPVKINRPVDGGDLIKMTGRSRFLRAARRYTLALAGEKSRIICVSICSFSSYYRTLRGSLMYIGRNSRV